MRKKSSVPYIRIVMLGSGNVATQLAIALRQNGFHISQVYSPNAKHAQALAKTVKASPVSALGKIEKTADAYILAVKDDAIAPLAKKLKLKDKLVIHTSGTAALSILSPASSNTGVLYPLQTISKERILIWRKIPICVEASGKPAKALLDKIARRISDRVVSLGTEERRVLHLAAVFACNFSNHMYSIAARLLKKQDLSFSLLIPLIQETAEKAGALGPDLSQTGPAARRDEKTIKKHLKMLSSDKNYRQLYLSISKSIREK
jgi:predicted short-subunit dehydrogenase-like oxidoreductase (DUF2520 family)